LSTHGSVCKRPTGRNIPPASRQDAASAGVLEAAECLTEVSTGGPAGAHPASSNVIISMAAFMCIPSLNIGARSA
jgi:hypothetical protein